MNWQDYSSDCKRIMKIALSMGYMITPETACTIWREHSCSYAAGWLFLPEDDTEIEWIVQNYHDKNNPGWIQVHG